MTDVRVEELFKAHHRGVLRYLTLAVGHADTARDLTQDVFVRVSQSAIPPDDSGRKAWVFTIARNLAIDHHRRRAIRAHSAVQSTPEPAVPDSTHTAAVVNQALATLDSVARDVFVMREVAGLSYGEIGVACGLSPDAVRSRIHRARLRLREHLQRPLADARARPMRAHFRKD